VFSDGVTIYTGSIGKYYGNGLYTLRLNSTPSNVGSSLSGALSARFYQDDADTYITASVGMGVSPDQPAWSTEVFHLHSRKASLGLQKRLDRVWIFSAGTGWERQEYMTGLFRIHWTYSMGLERRF
jgi:YaiO family outer membrane protein